MIVERQIETSSSVRMSTWPAMAARKIAQSLEMLLHSRVKLECADSMIRADRHWKLARHGSPVGTRPVSAVHTCVHIWGRFIKRNVPSSKYWDLEIFKLLEGDRKIFPSLSTWNWELFRFMNRPHDCTCVRTVLRQGRQGLSGFQSSKLVLLKGMFNGFGAKTSMNLIFHTPPTKNLSDKPWTTLFSVSLEFL